MLISAPSTKETSHGRALAKAVEVCKKTDAQSDEKSDKQAAQKDVDGCKKRDTQSDVRATWKASKSSTEPPRKPSMGVRKETRNPRTNPTSESLGKPSTVVRGAQADE
jgi:hypothetical protein